MSRHQQRSGHSCELVAWRKEPGCHKRGKKRKKGVNNSVSTRKTAHSRLLCLRHTLLRQQRVHLVVIETLNKLHQTLEKIEATRKKQEEKKLNKIDVGSPISS
jgi:hypothetical protein